MQRKKILIRKISPFCAIPTVSGSAGICRAGPSASQHPLSSASPKAKRQGWHWAGSAMGLRSASSRTAKPAPCHTPRGELRWSPRGLKGKGWGMLVLGTLQPWFTTPSGSVQAGQAAWCPKATPPAVPERDKPTAHTVPCFFHRFCVSISMELTNNSNMNIIHCIWAGVMSGREGIKSSKRLAGSAPARAGEGCWEGDERLRAHTIPTRASGTQPHFRAA